MVHFFSLFLLALPAFATTKLANSGQPVQIFCQVRAEFQGVDANRLKLRNKKSDLIFWRLNIVDVSNKDICPTERSISLRVRGASWASGNAENPKITYVVEVKEPKVGELFSAKIRFLEGRDSYTERDYKEWTLGELIND